MEYDEEIDVPNSPLDDYMKQFNLSNNKNENLSQVEPPTVKPFRKKQSKLLKRFQLNLFDLKYLSDLILNNFKMKQILTADDENFLSDELSVLKLSKTGAKAGFGEALVFLIIFIGLAACKVTLLSVGFVIFLILFATQKYYFRFFMNRLLMVIFSNVNLKHNLYLYLKQVSLNQIRDKNFCFDLNKVYRRYMFNYLYDEYFYLNNLNQGLALNSNCCDLKLLCKINQDELSDILKNKIEVNDEDDNNESNHLAKLTNNYDLNVNNCLLKLNYLQLSEFFKLILYNYMKNLSFKIYYSTLITILSVIIDFNFKNKHLDKLNNLMKLKETKTANIQQINKPLTNHNLNSYMTSLSLHLRNALLNSYKLNSNNANEIKIQDENDVFLGLIEREIEFCSLYLKQIKHEISGKYTAYDESKDTTNEMVDNLKINNETQNDATDVSLNEKKEHEMFDVIFEALSIENTKDLSDEDTTSENEAENGVELKLKAKEYELLNSNFYNELQQALETKKAEWCEREKQAKYIKDKNLVKYEAHYDTSKFEVSGNHDLLRYKSQLRNRNKRPSSKYKYEEFRDENSAHNENKNFLMNEFLLKKNEIFKVDLNYTGDDEIIYE